MLFFYRTVIFWRRMEPSDHTGYHGYGAVATVQELGALIRAFRKEQSFTLQKVSGLCNVSIRFLSELERGKETAELGKALWVLYRLGDYPAAVGHLERAVELEPGDPVINDHLGDAYWIVGRKNEARFQWIRALSLEPSAEDEAEIRLKLEGKKEPTPQPPGKNRDI